jgi:hypothetical protein
MFVKRTLMNEATDTPDAAAPASATVVDTTLSEPAAENAAPDAAAAAPTEEAPAEEELAPVDGDEVLEALAAMDGISRQQAPQQPQGLDPNSLARLVAEAQSKTLEPLVAQSRAVNELLATAARQQQQAQMQARIPQPPGEGATLADYHAYQQKLMQYHGQQTQQSVAGIAQQLRQEMQQTLEPLLGQLRQQAAQQQAESRQAALRQATEALAARPGYEYLRQPMKAAIVHALYNQVKGQGVSFQQVAQELAQEFGLAKPSQQAQASAVRQAATQSLGAARARVAGRQVLPGKGSSTGPKGATMGAVAKAKASGMWDALPDDLKEYKMSQDKQKGLI